MTLVRSTLAAALASFLAAALSGQVYIVDAAGGAGSHFTDLPQAVAAVPDGATLRVRPGDYHAFTLTGKGLAIVGDDSVNIMPQGSTSALLEVRGTSARQVVLLKNLVLRWGLGIRIQQAGGSVVLESITTLDPYQAVPTFAFEACVNVVVRDCILAPGRQSDAIQPDPRIRVIDSNIELTDCEAQEVDKHPAACTPIDGSPALFLLRSRAVVVRCRLQGGKGSYGQNCAGRFCTCNFVVVSPGDGGSGIEAHRSTLSVLDSQITGGTGWNTWPDSLGPVPAGHGGDGIRVLDNSAATALRVTFAGGIGGLPNGRPGVPSLLDSSSLLISDATASPTVAELLGRQFRGSDLWFVAKGAPRSPAVLVLAYRGDAVPLEPLGYGNILASPALTVGPFSLSALGELRGAFVLPPAWPLGETYFAQFLTLQPGPNTLWASNRLVLHATH